VREELAKEFSYKDELSAAKSGNLEKELREMTKKLEFAEYRLKDRDESQRQIEAKDSELQEWKTRANE
jgi:hypothetical protein